MSAPPSYDPNYWAWDSRRQDSYHADRLQDGTLHYTWRSSLNPPGTQQQPVHSPASSVPRTAFAPQLSQPSSTPRLQSQGGSVPLAAYHGTYGPSTTLRTVPGATFQATSTLGTSLSPTLSSAGSARAQIGQQPCPVQPRDPYAATAYPTAPTTSPGSAQYPTGRNVTHLLEGAARGYTYGQSSETGHVHSGQAASQSAGYRTAGQASAGFGQPVLATSRDEALTPRPQNASASPMSYQGRPGPGRETTYPKGTQSVTVHTSNGRGRNQSAVIQNKQQRKGSFNQTNRAGTTVQPDYICTSSHTGPAAGKKRAQSLQYHDQPVSEDQAEAEDEDSQLTQAFEASRISHKQDRRSGGPSRSGTGATSNTAAHTAPAVATPTSFLDPAEFKYIRYKTHKFFVVGKVFMLFYIENAGGNSDANKRMGPSFTTVAHGEHAHHQFRRFVVVREKSKEYYCYCCPITTYGSRGAAKPGVDQTVHTIAYTGNVVPARLPGEDQMKKDPIRIVPVNEAEKLDPRSRINIGKIYPIDHNNKVKDIGYVDEKSLPKLLGYRKVIRDGG